MGERSGTCAGGPTVRLGQLVDIPAAARLIEPGAGGRTGIRLLLAHVALESGGFWVATGVDGVPVAAAALLPPHPGSPSWSLLSGAVPGSEGLLPDLLGTALGAAPATGRQLAELDAATSSSTTS